MKHKNWVIVGSSILIILLAGMVVCCLICKKKITQQINAQNGEAATATTTEEWNMTYFDIMIRDAKPEWQRIKTPEFSLEIPYSSEWSVASLALTPYEPRHNGVSERLIIFGKPVSGASYLSREFSVYRGRIADMFDPQSFKTEDDIEEGLIVQLSNSCLDQTLAKKIKIGNIHAIEYTEGGTKGCGRKVAFVKGNYIYFVGRHTDSFSENIPEINDDMKRIIQSIR